MLLNVAAHNVSIQNTKVSKCECHITYSVTKCTALQHVKCTLHNCYNTFCNGIWFVMLYIMWCLFLKTLHFWTLTLCAATFCNITSCDVYVMLLYVMYSNIDFSVFPCFRIWHPDRGVGQHFVLLFIAGNRCFHYSFSFFRDRNFFINESTLPVSLQVWSRYLNTQGADILRVLFSSHSSGAESYPKESTAWTRFKQETEKVVSLGFPFLT